MVLGSSATNCTARGYLYGAIRCFTNSCSSATFAASGAAPSRSTTNALTIWPRASVGHADDAALGHVRVTEQRLLDLGPGDVVAGRDDHVVAACLEPEVAVGVADVGVAGEVPAVPHVVPLAVVGQVPAAGRALDGEPGRAGRPGPACPRSPGSRPVAGDGPAGRAGPDLVVGRQEMKTCSISVAADAVDDLHAGGVVERLPGRGGQVLARGDAAAAARAADRPCPRPASPGRRSARWTARSRRARRSGRPAPRGWPSPAAASTHPPAAGTPAARRARR